jgi:GxxExxY protein
MNRNSEKIDEDLDRIAYAVIGAAIEVHRRLGPGLPEAMYEAALCIEMESRGIPFERQVIVAATYRSKSIGDLRLDILVQDRLIVELKAADAIAPVHIAQVLTYLRIARKRLALLINFNVYALRDGIERIAL